MHIKEIFCFFSKFTKEIMTNEIIYIFRTPGISAASFAELEKN